MGTTKPTKETLAMSHEQLVRELTLTRVREREWRLKCENERQRTESLTKSWHKAQALQREVDHLTENLKHERRLHAIDCLEAGLRALYALPAVGPYQVLVQADEEGIALFKFCGLQEAISQAVRLVKDTAAGRLRWPGVDAIRVRVFREVFFYDLEGELPARLRRGR